MKKLSIALLLCSMVSGLSQTMSYWAQGFNRSPDAQSAGNYFLQSGTNILFTYANNRVVINLTGPISTNLIPNITPGGSGPWNVSGNNIWYGHTEPGLVFLYDASTSKSNIIWNLNGNAHYAGIVDVQSLYASKNIVANGTFFGDGSGLTNLPPASLTPWTSDINGSGYSLTNASIQMGGDLDMYAFYIKDTIGGTIQFSNGIVMASGNIDLFGNLLVDENLGGVNMGSDLILNGYTIYGDGYGLTNAIPALFPATNSPLGSLSYDGTNWYWRTVVNGTNGINGTNGLNGVNGTNGAAGPAGPAGTNAAVGLVTNVWTTNLTGTVSGSTINSPVSNSVSSVTATNRPDGTALLSLVSTNETRAMTNSAGFNSGATNSFKTVHIGGAGNSSDALNVTGSAQFSSGVSVNGSVTILGGNVFQSTPGVDCYLDSPANQTLHLRAEKSDSITALKPLITVWTNITFKGQVRMPTNSAPTGVTIGITTPDFWSKVYDATGTYMGFYPVWTNH